MGSLINHRKTVYDNCGIYAPDGDLLSYISERKAKWYISHNLAVQVSDNPLCIKLLFEPKNRSQPSEPIMHKKNMCVECATTEMLTRHHIVPYCFRILMSKSYSSHNSYDLAVMCRKCHNQYEIEAAKLKTILIQQFVPSYKTEMDKDFCKGKNIILKIRKDENTLTEIHRSVLYQKLEVIKNKWCIDNDDILVNYEKINFFKEVYDVLGTEFLVHFWQSHFYETVKPKYIGSYWKPYFIKTNEI